MKVINSISRWLSYVGIGLVVILMLLIVSDVFMRYVFNKPISGVAELVALMMASLALGVAWGGIKGRHISIDMVVVRFPPRVQAMAGIIALLIDLGVVVFIIWRSFVESLWALQSKEVASDLLLVPTFPFWWAYVLGLAMLCVVIVTILIQKGKGVAKG